MKKGLHFGSAFAVFTTIILLLFAVACGDGSDEDPTDSYINGGSIDEGKCKNACDKIARCASETSTDGIASFQADCREQCERSGFFEAEALGCIQSSECADIWDCGFTY